MREAIRDHKERRQQRRQLARSINRVRQQQARVKETGRRLAGQRKQHELESRQKRFQRQLKDQSRSDRLKLLQQQRETLEQDIAEIQDRHGISEKSPLGEFTDEELEARLETQQEKLNQLRDKLVRESEQRGRLRALIASEKDADAGRASTDWTALLHTADQLKRKLAESTQSVRQAAQSLAAQHGPSSRYEYLENAADYLSHLTRGQFVGIELVDEDQQMLLVDDQGRTISLEEVNPGHFPNLYFSLWLCAWKSTLTAACACRLSSKIRWRPLADRGRSMWPDCFAILWRQRLSAVSGDGPAKARECIRQIRRARGGFSPAGIVAVGQRAAVNLESDNGSERGDRAPARTSRVFNVALNQASWLNEARTAMDRWFPRQPAAIRG